jgi:ketosteroid isomerase-like protein
MMNTSIASVVKSALPALLLTTSLSATMALSGCATRDESLPKDVTSALETAFARGDVQACADLFADDAEIISRASAVVQGKDAITEFFKDQVQREILFDTDVSVSIVSGNVAMEQGTYRVRNVMRGIDVEHGDYLNVWRKSNGKWKAYRTMYNVTQSPGALVSVLPDSDDRSM